MSLAFIDRMRERQFQRRMEGTHIKVYHLQTQRGFLLDETGEPVEFLHNTDGRGNFDEAFAFKRAQCMTAQIDQDYFGPCELPNSQAYYQNVPTLNPL